MNDLQKFINSETKYDFIANNYWNMSKENLKDILLECIAVLTPEQVQQVNENIIEWRIN